MTAQIITFPRNTVRTQVLASAPMQARRALRLTEQGRAIVARLNRGEVITDLGQIDKPTRRLLKRWLDKGWVYRGEDYTFPKTKTCWAGAGFWDVSDDEPLPVMPLNVKFREL